MKLIVGLGNLGDQFQNTRHNTGFLVVERLVLEFGKGDEVGRWELNEGLRLEVCHLTFNICHLIFAKPGTGMNSSGDMVKKVIDREEIKLDNLLLVHDDLDLFLGDFKLQKGRGAAGHRGVRSVIDALGFRDFWRLRVGIGRPPEGIAAEDYVLEDFTSDERGVIDELIEKKLVEVVSKWIELNSKRKTQSSKPQLKVKNF